MQNVDIKSTHVAQPEASRFGICLEVTNSPPAECFDTFGAAAADEAACLDLRSEQLHAVHAPPRVA